MFARLTIVQVQPDKVDEVIKVFEEGVIPAAKKEKGFQKTYLLTDRQTGKGLSITMWNTEADAVANESSGYYQEQVGKFKDYFTSAPVRESYEVTLQG